MSGPRVTVTVMGINHHGWQIPYVKQVGDHYHSTVSECLIEERLRLRTQT
jgi:hypothetical protein